MKASKILSQRLAEVLTNGTWVTGTNFKEQIADVNWKDAITRLHGLNSIALLTFHLHYYISGVLQVFQGGKLEIHDQFSFDAQPIHNEEDWDTLRDAFNRDSLKLIDIIDQFPSNELDAHFDDPKYGSNRRNINLMIEHCYYHLGQVVLIKKMIQRGQSGI